MLRRVLIVGGTVALLLACSKAPPHPPLVSSATVLALGDSLTYGSGASTDGAAWPALLARSTGWTVINAGVPGDTSQAALERLPALLEEHRPQLVLVSLGGNDFLRGIAAEQTDAALRQILVQVRSAGAKAVLVAVPRPSAIGAAIGKLSDHPLYESVAQGAGVPLLAAAWSEVLSDGAMKSDTIHANDRGYARFAELAQRRLKELGFIR